jgi:4-amino-4-deoxy-L-arabinose transferase-like glycosyltransferase
VTSLAEKITQQWQLGYKPWALVLAAAYLALIPVLARLEDVQGVTYLLVASAAACLLLRWLPSVVLWLPLPVSLSWVAGMMARVPPAQADYYLAFGLWLVAILLFVAILLVPLVVENRGKLPAMVRAIPWPEVAAVAVITGVAFAARFILLASEPGPFWQDEGIFASGGLEVAKGIRQNFFFMGPEYGAHMYYLTTGIPFKLFGASIFWARLPHAIIGTITVPLLYLMLREMFDRRVALVGAAFVAVYHFHVHFSRQAAFNIYDTFFVALVLLFAFRAIRTQNRLDFGLAGLALGLQFYFFSGSRLLVPMMIVLLVYVALKTRGAFVARNFWGLGTLLAGFVIATLPAALFWDANRDLLSVRWKLQNIFSTGWLDGQVQLTGRSELHILWDQFQHSIGALLVYPDAFQNYNAGIPLLTGVGSVFFVIGGVYALFHIFQPRFVALFALLLLIVIFLGTLLKPPLPLSGVAEQRYLGTIPISAAFVGVGLVVLAEAAAKLIPRWRAYVLPAVLAAGVLLIAFVNLNFYFGTYVPSDNLGRGRHLPGAQMAEYLEAFDSSYTVYFFDVQGLHPRDWAMLFRSRDKIFVEVFEDGTVGKTFVEARRFTTGEAAEEERESRPDALFLVPTARSSELAQIVAMCPNGLKSEVFETPAGSLRHTQIPYQWYEVLDAKECVDGLQLSGILKG